MREDTKDIYLEHHGRPHTIPLAVYEQIKALVQASLVCQYCTKQYTAENPMVVENVCLGCFLKHRDMPPRDLTFLGEVASDYAERYGYKVYKFTDRKGFIYITDSHRKISDPIEQSISATLRHYGFPVPEQYTLKSGKTVDLNAHSWRSIYGDFHTSPVVMATYHEYYGDHLATAFLLYRDGTSVEFTRRKKQHRTWYEQAKAEIEATYRPHQGYVVGTDSEGRPYTAYQLNDHHMYEGIVARARQEYTQTHKE